MKFNRKLLLFLPHEFRDDYITVAKCQKISCVVPTPWRSVPRTITNGRKSCTLLGRAKPLHAEDANFFKGWPREKLWLKKLLAVHL